MLVGRSKRFRNFFAGGDIFVHAKCNLQSKLFELVQVVLRELPKDSVANFEDVYGWVYKNGRDLSGFIDGELLTVF